jgi:hypothetical protein
MEHITHDVSNRWHVFVKGEWRDIEYDGYAPVDVWVETENGERLCAVEYRHTVSGCTERCPLK